MYGTEEVTQVYVSRGEPVFMGGGGGGGGGGGRGDPWGQASPALPSKCWHLST